MSDATLDKSVVIVNHKLKEKLSRNLRAPAEISLFLCRARVWLKTELG